MMVMKSIECNPDCGFMIRSHEQEEVLSVAKIHAKIQHRLNPTFNELKKMMKSIKTI
ncbi:MAG: DUF1059 domain-containing protein [Candidatus Aenigmarchaeota archaeon]|nr:DUF1059 domain-containing protein [Candidatus Aenigmarchaeota archaeon]